MSRSRIVHQTTYRYSEPVQLGMHKLVVRPREGHDLHVEEIKLAFNPGALITWHRDLFGNSIAFARFQKPSEILDMRNEVIIVRRDQSSHRELLEFMPIRYPIEHDALEEAVLQGYLAPVYDTEAVALRDWVTSTFQPRQGHGAVQLAQSIGEWIYKNIRYRRREDRGVQSPLETLRLESGSCRDMATLMLEAVRTLKMATRFASGYLDSAASAAGRAATHAWTEFYLPSHGWFGFDPTLGKNTSHKHIVVGVSSHPRGVMPISGTYSGPRECYLGMKVSVTIEPLAMRGSFIAA